MILFYMSMKASINWNKCTYSHDLGKILLTNIIFKFSISDVKWNKSVQCYLFEEKYNFIFL